MKVEECQNKEYCIIETMEEFYKNRRKYEYFVIKPHRSLNDFSHKIIVDNMSIVFPKVLLDKYLCKECFFWFNTKLVSKLKNIEYIDKNRSLITKEDYLESLKKLDFSKKNIEAKLYVIENTYRDIHLNFTTDEKKTREIYRNKLLVKSSSKSILQSKLFTEKEKKRLLKLKKKKYHEYKKNKKCKTFSIVTTVYNGEKDLKQFAEMIKAINYPNKKFELIIIDDGSTDKTNEICGYLNKSPIMYKYIKKENEGVSKARNIAIDIAQMEYVLFIDFDDIIAPNILTEYNNLLNEYPEISIVSCPIYKVNGEKRILHQLSRKKISTRRKINIINLNKQPELYISNVAGIAIKRERINNLEFKEKLNFFEDTSWINKLINNQGIIEYGFANDTYYDYISSGSNSLVNQRFSNQEQISLLVEEYMSVLNSNSILASKIVTLRSLNWFLSDALNAPNKEISSSNMQLLKKLAWQISEQEQEYLTGERVKAIILLLRDQNEWKYQEYMTATNKIDYYLYSDYSLCANEKYINKLFLFNQLIGYEVKKYTPLSKSPKKQIKSIMLMDKIFETYDNAYYLYKYLQNNTELKIFYVLSEKSKYWDILSAEGFNLVSYASTEYKALLVDVDCIMSSHVDKYILNYGNLRENINEQTFVFLQHGVINNDLKYWLFNKKIDYICSTYEFESKLISEYFEQEQIIECGLVRNDYLKSNEYKYITYFTSWSSFLVNLDDEEFENTGYFKRIINIFQASALKKIADEKNLSIQVKVHPNLAEKVRRILKKYQFEISVCEYQELITSSYIALTDFSSVIFDTYLCTNETFFYNDNYEEYFCERKIQQCIEYDNFFIKRIEKIEEIENYISSREKIEEKSENCDNCKQLLKELRIL